MIKKAISVLFLAFFVLFVWSEFVFANTNNSENYEIVNQLDLGGSQAGSENYQISGMLTNMDQLVFWPGIYVSDDEEKTLADPMIVAEGVITQLDQIQIGREYIEINDYIDVKIFGDMTLIDLAGLLNIPLASAGAVLTLIILLLTQFFSGVAILSPVSSLYTWVLSIFSIGKKKEKWGTVYDSQANAPVPGALVQVFDKEFDRLLNTKTTDKEGRFLFYLNPGKYYIKVIKTNYNFPSTTKYNYTGEVFTLGKQKEVAYQIPIDPVQEVLVRRINIVSRLIGLLNFIRVPVLIIGTFFSIVVLYIDNNIFNILILCLYVIIWIIEIYKIKKSRPFGQTKDRLTNDLMDSVIVRLFNDRDKLVSTCVSNHGGKFSFLVNKGSYYLTAVKGGYQLYKSDPITFDKSGGINVDIYMLANIPKIQIKPSFFSPVARHFDKKQVGNKELHNSWY
jgi:hypothetical protein